MNKQINKNNNNNSNNNGNKKQLVAGNTNSKIEVVSAIKRTEILKYTCFHVIPYIHSPVMGLFPHISMATMTTFPGTSLIVKKTNWVV